MKSMPCLLYMDTDYQHLSYLSIFVSNRSLSQLVKLTKPHCQMIRNHNGNPTICEMVILSHSVNCSFWRPCVSFIIFSFLLCIKNKRGQQFSSKPKNQVTKYIRKHSIKIRVEITKVTSNETESDQRFSKHY